MSGMDRFYKRQKEKQRSTPVPTANGGMDRYYKKQYYNSLDTSGVDEKYINSFLTDANNFLKNSEKEYGSMGWGNAASSYEAKNKSWSELNTRYDTIKGWLYKNRSNLDEKSYKNLSESLDGYSSSASSIIDAFKNAVDYYSQWDTEDAYNEWYKSEEERKALLNSKDFEYYSQIGANIENPEYDDARIYEYNLWDRIFKEDINNPVTFGRNNKDSLGKLIGGASSSADVGDVNKYYRYNLLTDDEASIYNYYLGKGDTQKAEEYLVSLDDTLRKREAGRVVENIGDSKFLQMVFAAGAGLDQFASGIANIDNYIKGTEADPTTVTQYASSEIRNNLGGFWGGAYDLTSTTFNMLPSVLVGGAPGLATMGTSVVGNAYSEMRNLGYDEWQSRGYATLVGAAETGLQYLLGGINKLGGKVSGNAIGKFVSKFDNALAKTAITLGGNMASEGIEEAIQTVLEPAFKALVTGEDFESPEWEEVLYSALLGALSAGVMEGPLTAVGTVMNNHQTRNEYGSVQADLVNEGIELGGEAGTLAEKYQAKLNKGKDLSGGQLNRLIQANEKAITSQDTATIKSATVERLTQLGEQGDINTLADVLVKQASGETLTRPEQNLIKESKFGQRVANELNPENISSGEYSSSWAEKLDTNRINPEEYSRLIANMEEADKGSTEAQVVESATKPIPESKTTPTTETIANEGLQTSETTTETVAEEEGTVTLAEASKKYGAQAQAMIHTYTEGQNVAQYDKAYQMAYDMGRSGVSLSYAMNSDSASYLTEDQRKLAYEAGKASADTFAKEKDAKNKQAANGKTGRKKGTVKGENVSIKDLKKTFNDTQNKAYKILTRIAEVTGYDIVLFKSEKTDAKGNFIEEQGRYKISSNTIYIDINAGLDNIKDVNDLAKYSMLRTFGHEFTHSLEQNSPIEYNELRKAVFERLTEMGEDVNDLIEQKMALYEDLTYEQASREVVADAMTDILPDSHFIEILATKHQNLFQKLLAKLKEFLNSIKEYFSSLDPNSSTEANALKEEIDGAVHYVESIVELFDKAAVKAVETYQSKVATEEKATKTTKVEAKTDVEKLEEAGIGFDEETQTVYALRHSPARRDASGNVVDLITVGKKSFNIESIAQLVSKATGRSIEDARKWVNSEVTIANIIMNSPEFLDFEADNRYEAIKKNSDYPQGTVDLSNLCPKRTEFTSMFDMLQKKYPNKLFTASDVASMREILKSADITVACGACFVEDRRQLLGEIADTYIGMWKEAVDTGKPLQKTNAEGKKITLKVTSALAKQYGLKQGADILATDTYIPTQYDLTTYEGFKLLEKNHPIIAMGFNRYNNSRGQQAGRLIEGRAEYNRQILGWSDAKVRSVNNNGGLRIFSFSDFEVVHLLDIVQVILDCAAKGVKIQGYTKIPSFAKLVRNTGIKLNRSLIPKGQTGVKTVNGKQVLDIDMVEGIDINDENFIDESDNPDIGNIIIGINPTQIGIAMLDDFIDYIIPFHTNKSKAICKQLGVGEWVNYKESQHERDISTGKASKHNVNIYTQVINKYHPKNKVEFVNAFLEECRKQKKIPRYSEFLNKEYKADGTYQDEYGAFDYTYREGYHKFPIDFKMFDKEGNILPQGNITPELDNEFMTELLKAEVDKKQSYEFPQEVYDRLDKEFGEDKVQLSKRDTSYMDAVNRGDMKTAQKMVDEAAKELPNFYPQYKKIKGEMTKIPLKLWHYSRVVQEQGASAFTEFNVPAYFSKNQDYASYMFRDGFSPDFEKGKQAKPFYITANKQFNMPNIYGRRMFSGKYYMENHKFLKGLLDENEMYHINEFVEDERIVQAFRDNGYDVIYDKEYGYDTYIVLNANQIFSADPVTYDDDGNVIPLSERFNAENDDIRYSKRVLMGSLFSGGGTLEAGLVYQMLDKEFAVEYNEKIASAYTDNHGKEHMFVGDVRDFDSKDKQKVFYLHASPVCKNFSAASHSGGETTLDITTAQATARVLEEQMPEAFTVENVKRYIGSEAYNIIADKLNELGYTWDVDVYKASDYGNATKRERMIVRAVKSGHLPEKPQKVSNITSWGEATRDLWETDLIPSTLVKSKIEAIKNTPQLKNLKLTKLDKPLMIYDTTKGKTITFAWADELAPTLTTKCGDARIIMPDGRVYAPTPKFMGRIQGLPDDYKYPESKTRAFTIIGNGIPTQLTKAVIGGVLDSAYEQTHDGDVLYSKRAYKSNKFISAVTETANDYKARGSWSGKLIINLYKEHPEYDYLRRIHKGDENVISELEDLVSQIEDINLLDSLLWYPVYVYGVEARKTLRKAINSYKKVINSRIQAIMEAKVNGTDVGMEVRKYELSEIRSLFDSLNTNADMGKLADKVFKLAERLDLDIQGLRSIGASNVAGASLFEQVAYRVPYFNDKAYSDQDKAKTILHELIHSCTSYAIRAVERNRTLDEGVRQGVLMLESIYNQIKTDPLFEGEYGTKSVYEMVAELSNPEFRAKLQQRNLWQRFIDALKSLLGIQTKTGTYLEGAELALNYMLDNFDSWAYDLFVEGYSLANRRQGKMLFSEIAENTEAREFADSDVQYSIRKEAPPKKTKEGYKVFVVKDGKLYPPMVANPNAEDTPVGVWLNADVGTRAADSKTGRPQVKAGGKGTQGGSGSLAFRPGWHLGETPLATQFDRLNPETGVKELFPENFVWALCDIAADHDYQEEAMSYGYTKNGKFQHSLAGLPKLPTDGYYKYRTNPNPDTVPWLITGAMKVKKLLSDAEVNAILESKGLSPKQRVGGNKTLADLGLSEYEGKVFSDRDTQLQYRTKTFSDREVLQLASEEIKVEDLTQAEKDALDIFKKRLAKLESLQEERKEKGSLWHEQQFGENGDRAKANETLKRMQELDKQIQKAMADVLSVEEKEVLSRVLKKARKVVETHERERNQDILKRWRDRRDNAADIKKYRDRIRKDVEDLYNWIQSPDNKSITNHVPEVLRDAVVPFLSSINFMSKRALNGGDATKSDEAFIKNLYKVQEAVKSNISAYGLYSGYTDLPEDFMETLDAYIKVGEALMKQSKGDFIINQMTSEELKTLSSLVANIKQYIKNFNRFLYNSMYQHVYDAGDDSIGFLEGLKDAGDKTGSVSNFLFWQQIRPAYAFERFGKGGEAIYDGLRRGFAKLAFNGKEIVKFTEETYTDKEVNEWENDIKEFRLGSDILRIPVSYIMGLHELYKDPDGKRHILEGGIRVATYSHKGKKISDNGHTLTLGEFLQITGTLTDRQKEVADKLQKHMAEKGAEWGNYVTVARYGEEQFTNPNYYPINSDGRYLPATVEEHPSSAALYALLNMSFTKQRNEKANNRVVIYSIFDVFANHMASMSQYNAMALPILDTLKWFNYEQVSIGDDGTKTVLGSLRREMARVYGVPEETKPGSGKAGYAEAFVTNIIKDFNGTSAHGTQYDTFGLKALRVHNMAQVAYNIRVIAQQPFAITRAGMLISYKSILKGLKMSPKAIKKNVEEMRQYSGIAAWKSLGFYDVNISRGLTQVIKHSSTVRDKIADVGMWGAEKADTLTWSAMWSACKEEVIKKQKLTPESEGFYEAVTKLFEDVIYKTQVVDSILTKNEYMRDKGFVARAIGSFMSESTTNASMLLDAVDKYNLDIKRGMSKRDAWQKNGKMIGRRLYVYGVGAVLISIATAFVDALRDDDDYEEWYEKWLDAFGGNVFDELMPFNKLPIVADFYDLAKEIASIFGADTYGNPPQSVIMQWYDSLINGTEIIADKIMGEDSNYTWYGGIAKLLQAASSMTGLPMASATREAITLWNNTVGAMAPSLKVHSYEPSEMSKIRNAYTEGNLTYEEAVQHLLEQGLVDTEDEAYFTVQGWEAGEGYSRYDKIFDAVLKGESIDEVMTELTSHGYTEKDVQSSIKSQIGKWYYDSESDVRITKQQAIEMLKKYTDMDDDEITSTINKWSCEVVTGIKYNDIGDEFLKGNITSSRAIEMYMRYGGLTKDEATEKVEVLKFVKEHPEMEGISYSAVNGYNTYCKPNGVPIETFYKAWKYKGTLSGTVKEQMMDYINSLNLSSRQKDSLYLAFGWAESKLYQAPWH